jgi:hypothetical protein
MKECRSLEAMNGSQMPIPFHVDLSPISFRSLSTDSTGRDFSPVETSHPRAGLGLASSKSLEPEIRPTFTNQNAVGSVSALHVGCVVVKNGSTDLHGTISKNATGDYLSIEVDCFRGLCPRLESNQRCLRRRPPASWPQAHMPLRFKRVLPKGCLQ